MMAGAECGLGHADDGDFIQASVFWSEVSIAGLNWQLAGSLEPVADAGRIDRLMAALETAASGRIAIQRVSEDLAEQCRPADDPGLTKVEGRMTGRSLPEPSRADQVLSAKLGEPEPLRARLERKVRACAAVATSEEHFTQIAKAKGLLVRPRLDSRSGAVVGYSFADRDGRRSAAGGPIWFGGGKLAPDLTVTRLRGRCQDEQVGRSSRAPQIGRILGRAKRLHRKVSAPGPRPPTRWL
jgi:hypothetical protein